VNAGSCLLTKLLDSTRSSEGESTSDDDIDIEFRCAYESFNDEQKWRLKTGRTVEDVLYKAYRKDPSSTAATRSGRDWVIDLDDDSMRGLFEPEEWEEITASLPKIPSPNDDLVLYLSQFYDVCMADSIRDPCLLTSSADNAKVCTTDKLRNALRETSCLPEGTPYNRDEHYDLEWAEAVLRGL
jgi:hypothetical protein